MSIFSINLNHRWKRKEQKENFQSLGHNVLKRYIVSTEYSTETLSTDPIHHK